MLMLIINFELCVEHARLFFWSDLFIYLDLESLLDF